MVEAFGSVIVSHRGFWHKPTNRQTNKTEMLEEVKLAVNVRPPYTQTCNIYSRHLTCCQSYRMFIQLQGDANPVHLSLQP